MANQEAHPPSPSFYLSFQQVRDSGLLSPGRLAELETEINRRLTTPFDGNGNPIITARLANLFPYGSFLYPRADHYGDPWEYAKRQILAAILTDAERKDLNANAFRASSHKRDQERFEKAEKVPERDWSEGVFHGDTYYPSTDEMWEMIVCNGTDREDYPTYCWAAKAHTVVPDLDVSDVVEHYVCDRGWEDMDTYDLNGVPELQAALDVFVKANESVVSYQEDTSLAVLLERPTSEITS